MTTWTVACQAPLSVGFSRQEYWNGWPFPSPEDLPNPGIESASPVLQGDSLPSEPPGKQKSWLNVAFRNVAEFMWLTLTEPQGPIFFKKKAANNVYGSLHFSESWENIQAELLQFT